MKVYELLQEMGYLHCEECKCAIGEDWEYKDFSSKTIVICPQCKHELCIEKLGGDCFGLDKEEKEFIISTFEKFYGYSPSEQIASRILSKLKRKLGQ
jgi:NAD-dependent SIR2 family protein deacetylase